MAANRTLHFVYKIGNRKETSKFYRDVLGMKVLRHEEFEEGCKAACNGRYDGTWSKTMIGYGPEDDSFVCELTYNYGIGKYIVGNDYLGMTIHSSQIYQKCKNDSNCVDDECIMTSPCGYKFIVCNKDVENAACPVTKVTLGCSNLEKSIKYWTEVGGMKIFEQKGKKALLGYEQNQAKVEFQELGVEIDHKTAFGRTAIGCPRSELPGIQEKAKASGNKILTELVSLDTPGKATVDVVILADPDGHEICFVGDEAFKTLSQVDPEGDKLLNDAMDADKSDEWFAKKKKQKPSA